MTLCEYTYKIAFKVRCYLAYPVERRTPWSLPVKMVAFADSATTGGTLQYTAQPTHQLLSFLCKRTAPLLYCRFTMEETSCLLLLSRRMLLLQIPVLFHGTMWYGSYNTFISFQNSYKFNSVTCLMVGQYFSCFHIVLLLGSSIYDKVPKQLTVTGFSIILLSGMLCNWYCCNWLIDWGLIS